MVPMDGGPTMTRELGRAEVLQRLASVRHGRVVFTQRALPAIRPVNHILDGDGVVICSHGSTALAEAGRGGAVLAFQADEIDPALRAAWSVVVTGLGRLVSDPGEASRYRTALGPWLGSEPGDIIRIGLDLVTGFELRPAGRA
jgi:nitroimidazol reductase NimA-like FMN-containing flavoprotein (pyridoxamine 5'-phosphate oxidase superfamily)